MPVHLALTKVLRREQNKTVLWPQEKNQPNVKKECESVSKWPAAETHAFMLCCHHSVRKSEQRPMEVQWGMSVHEYAGTCCHLGLSASLLRTLTKRCSCEGTGHPLLQTDTSMFCFGTFKCSLCLSSLLVFLLDHIKWIMGSHFPFVYSTIIQEGSFINISCKRDHSNLLPGWLIKLFPFVSHTFIPAEWIWSHAVITVLVL